MYMEQNLSRARFPLMALGMFALLAALWAGMLRLGWGLPLPLSTLPAAHGPLMICGFLGTLIGVERAVALGRRWPYVVPLCTGMGGLVLIAGFTGAPGSLLMGLGSLGFVLVSVLIVYRQPALYTVTMALGALSWLIGNGLWLAGWPMSHVVPWWTAFLVLTIAGERLELSRLLRLSRRSKAAFLLSVSLILLGLCLSTILFDRGVRLYGVGLLTLALWLLHYDIARRTVRRQGLPRFVAVSLLSGYVWLGVGGLLGLMNGGIVAGPLYDAMLHVVFVGFVFAMIFGHAPIIFPAVLNLSGPVQSTFYAPLLMLHLSLLLRAIGDLAGWSPGRQWGGLLNVMAVLLFLGKLVHTIWRGNRSSAPVV